MGYLRAFRASAWTLFATGILHLMGHVKGARDFTNPPDEATHALARAMMGHLIPDFPVARSVASIYLGFSLSFSAFALILGALIVILCSELKDNPSSLRRFARIYLAGLLILTVISVNYFIWPPTICLLVAFGFGAVALAGLRRAQREAGHQR